MGYKICEICDKSYDADCPRHHFVHKSELKKHEKVMPEFQMDICTKCHLQYHSQIGMAIYYRKPGLIERLTERCHNDSRWLKRIAGFKYKQLAENNE